MLGMQTAWSYVKTFLSAIYNYRIQARKCRGVPIIKLAVLQTYGVFSLKSIDAVVLVVVLWRVDRLPNSHLVVFCFISNNLITAVNKLFKDGL